MRKLIVVFLLALPVLAQTTKTRQIVIRCSSSSRLSTTNETVIYKDCDDGKNYVSKDGAAFTELATTTASSTALGVRVTNSATISLPNDTAVTLTWDTETRDDDGFHSTVTNTDRLTTDTAGWHLVVGNIGYSPSGLGIRYCYILINGTTPAGLVYASAENLFTHAVQCTALVYLSVNDYVILKAYQDSGSTLTTQPAEQAAVTSFSMIRF